MASKVCPVSRNPTTPPPPQELPLDTIINVHRSLHFGTTIPTYNPVLLIKGTFVQDFSAVDIGVRKNNHYIFGVALLCVADYTHEQQQVQGLG